MDEATNALDEIKELADIYEIQRERIERLVEQERTGTPMPSLHKEVDSATKLLVASFRAKEALGFFGPPVQEEAEARLQIKNYSEQTVAVLSNPESRHRIMSLLERLTRYGKGRPEVAERICEMQDEDPVNGKSVPFVFPLAPPSTYAFFPYRSC